MTTRPEAVSPVTSPRTSTLTTVFSVVRTAARNRLDHTIPSQAHHNRLPNIIAQGPAAVPRAYVQNPLVAEVRSFEPGPGLQLARRNVLNVRSEPGHKYDGVTDALQRYFNVEPRREPSADPRDEASVVRHPQGIIQSSARWTQDMFYQFADNGAANYQIRPDYRIWGGRLELELTDTGQTTVFASETSAPRPAAIRSLHYYDPANAAQEAFRRIQAILADSGSTGLLYPLKILYDPANAAQSAFRKIQADLDRAQQIRDTFFRPGPALSNWS